MQKQLWLSSVEEKTCLNGRGMLIPRQIPIQIHIQSHIQMIQVDISGHPPSPTGSKQFSGNFGNLLFLAVFWVLNFRSHFEALNDVFLRKRGATWIVDQCSSPKICIPRIDLSNKLLSAPNRDHMQKLRP
jgi:hypothetical protein